MLKLNSNTIDGLAASRLAVDPYNFAITSQNFFTTELNDNLSLSRSIWRDLKVDNGTPSNFFQRLFHHSVWQCGA